MGHATVQIRTRCAACFRGAKAAVISVFTMTGIYVAVAAPGHADPAPVLEQAVISARGAAGCGQLRIDPLATQAAEIMNQSTMAYLDHTGQDAPADDPHPTAIVKDLGIEGTKSYALQGAGLTPTDAIKGLLVQGFDVIPDCSYTEVGTSMLHESNSGYTLVVAVLVGP